MADKIEEKALALWNVVQKERGLALDCSANRRFSSHFEAICRAIEAHEADKQAFSDAVEGVLNDDGWSAFGRDKLSNTLRRFIIKKPDPLVDILDGMMTEKPCKTASELSEKLRQALAARGLKIVEANNAPL